MEIIITIIIVSAAGFILYKNLKSKKSSGCNCENCTSHCSYYKIERKK